MTAAAFAPAAPPTVAALLDAQDGVIVCCLDAWWERQRVAAELDGAHHRTVRVWDGDGLRANGVVIAERHDRVRRGSTPGRPWCP